MFGNMRWRGTAKTLSVTLVLAMLLNLAAPAMAAPKSSSTKLAGRISEVSPPEVIQQLHDLLDQYQPQVSIVSPRPNEVLQDNTVSVKFSVKDLPLRKDEKLGLGSHLHVFLDDQPYQAVYDVSQPIVFKDLAAGTHTIRAFAGRPWHESFKNDGAFAQTTFHIFTKTPNNNPDPKQPLLTYSRPQSTYGAEPILLDFYLTNAPLHLIAQEDDKDDVADWKVKVTVNGDSFTVDRWQPIYLQGFKPGKNWVQLEYVDDKGNLVPNVYNNTARVFTYEPNGKDALSRLVRGEIPFEEAVSIVDPNYKPAAKAPEMTPTPEVAPVPVVPPVGVPPAEPEGSQPAEPDVSQPVDEEPLKPTKEKQTEAPNAAGGFFNRFKKRSELPKPESASEAPAIEPELTAPEGSAPAVIEPEIIEPEVSQPDVAPVRSAPEASKASEKPKGDFFDRFKRPETPKVPVDSNPVPAEVTEPEEKADEPEVPTPILPEVQPVKPSPAPGGFFNRFKPPVAPIAPAPIATPENEPPAVEKKPAPVEVVPAPELKEAPTLEPKPEVIEIQPAPAMEKLKPSFFDRFKRPTMKSTPSEAPAPAEVTPTPAVEEPPTPEAEPEAVEVMPTPEAKKPKSSFFDRFKRPELKPAPTPAPIETPALPETTPIPEEQTVPTLEAEPEVIEIQPAPAEETPKTSFFDRFKRPAVKPAPTPIETPAPPEITPIPEEQTVPTLEAEPEVIEIQPAPAVKKPKSSFFDRFKRPESTPTIVAPSPTPVPETLSNPDTESPAVLETYPAEEAQPKSKSNPLEKLREVTPKPTEPPVVEKVEPPAREEAPLETSPPLDFEPQTELERRLGIPLKPRMTQPAPNPKPALSSEGNAE